MCMSVMLVHVFRNDLLSKRKHKGGEGYASWRTRVHSCMYVLRIDRQILDITQTHHVPMYYICVCVFSLFDVVAEVPRTAYCYTVYAWDGVHDFY